MSFSQFGKIGVSWGFLTFAGVYLFILSKKSVENRRIESMQIRNRMKKSNSGEYEKSDRRFNA